jgi:alkylation response protein AidB-like acyl-CoA dehydrogenase
MASIDLETQMSEEEQAVRETVHKFAEEVMRPAGIALDALADPQDVIAKDSILWDVIAKHRELGLDEIADPASGLSPVQQARLRSIISEELGWGDSGLAICFGVTTFPRMLAQMSGKPALLERYAGPEMIGCWAITEPDHGSDQIRFATDPDVKHLGKPNCSKASAPCCFRSTIRPCRAASRSTSSGSARSTRARYSSMASGSRPTTW